MGRDEIPAIVLKNCSLVIAPCLALIINSILRDGEYPQVWKVAIVIPIAKGKLSSNPADYRPISLLPIISKVVEKCISEFILMYVGPHLSKSQFGFRQGCSTTDAILFLQHLVLRGFEKCEKARRKAQVVIVYFDIAKAFDTVHHQTLLRLLSDKYSLPPYLMSLIKSYLSNRSMKIKVGNEMSKDSPVTSGVPQGSVLGPLLFVAYIDSTIDVISNDGSQLVLYADDMALVHAINTENEVEKIQEDLVRLSKGIENLKLSFNEKKCKVQVISLSTSKTNQVNISLSLNDVELEQVSSFRYLGVDIDSKLSFTQQSQRVTTRTKTVIGELNRTLRKWAPKTVFKEAVTTIAFPLFTYAIEAWFPCALKDQRRIERIVKFAARLCLNDFSHQTNYIELLKRLEWKSVSRIVSERRLLTIRKYLDGTRCIPECVFPVAIPTLSRHSQRLKEKNDRQSLLLAVFSSQQNKVEDVLGAAQMRLLWNSLNEKTINLPFIAFKEEVCKNEFYESLCERGLCVCALE
jgi:hypothetical protein